MDNRIVARLGPRADLIGLLTLLSLLPLDTYALGEWNGALSQVLGRRVLCPSYRALSRYLQRAVLGLQ